MDHCHFMSTQSPFPEILLDLTQLTKIYLIDNSLIGSFCFPLFFNFSDFIFHFFLII